MKSTHVKEYLTRPVPDAYRANFTNYFASPETANLFLSSLDTLRRKHDISDWKKEITKTVAAFENDANVPKHVLRDAVTDAMDFGAQESLFGNISGEYDDIGKSSKNLKTMSRITLDDDELLTSSRYSLSLRGQKSESMLRDAPNSVNFTTKTPNFVKTNFSANMPNFVNLDRHAIQNALQRLRMEKIYRTPVVGRTFEMMSNASMYARKAVAKKLSTNSQHLFMQASALAQKLFAEIARNPESFVHLSQNETSALNSAKATAPTRSFSPKAALRIAAINAMNQAYPAPRKVDTHATASAQVGVSSLQAAIMKVEDDKKKLMQHEFVPKDMTLDEHLTKLGYTEAETARLTPILAENAALAGYIDNGTISTRKDLDCVLKSVGTIVKAKQLR